MAETIPRGVQVLTWKNADKSKSVRYRVRISRADFKTDKLFDSLDEAVEFLRSSKSKAGRQALIEGEERQRLMQQSIQDYLLNPTLSHYLDRYAREMACRDLFDENSKATPTKIRSQEATRYRINNIKRIELTHLRREHRANLTGHLSGKSILSAAPKKPFGEFKLMDITEATASEFLRERRRTAAASTVQRELNLLRAFFNKLRFLDRSAWDKLDENPFTTCDKTPLQQPDEEERDEAEGRLPVDAEERLFAELAKCRNKEMLQIVALALATGMRRGELLELEWDRIKEDRIILRSIDTKTRRKRSVPLNDAAKSVIQTISHRDEHLFHYTPDGFASNWDRIRKRANIGGFRFHDTRREFISRLIEQISSPIAISKTVGLSDVRHLEKTYLEPLQRQQMHTDGIKSEHDLMQAVGHGSKQMTAHYYAPKGKK